MIDTTKNIQLFLGDCLEIMKEIPNESIDMILCDLPYGTSACSWDSIIDLDKLWIEYKRILKEKGNVVLFAQQPFTSILIHSNLEMYKYNWIWRKDNATNFMNSHYQPLKITEDICVFSFLGCSYNKKGNPIYNPQFFQGKAYRCKTGKHDNFSAVVREGSGGRKDIEGYETVSDGKRFPLNLIEFKRDKENFHPTQKPLELLKYLVKTYSNENELILDNTMGSGTTGVACKLLNRRFIGIELLEEYMKIAQERIKNTTLEIREKEDRQEEKKEEDR